jgi:hypothetical protein
MIHYDDVVDIKEDDDAGGNEDA